MVRSFSIIFVFGVMVSSVIGYATAISQSKYLYLQLDSLKSDLHSLAQDMSTYLQLEETNLSATNSDDKLYSKLDQNKLISEIQTLIYDVVNKSLKDSVNDVNQTILAKAQYCTEWQSNSEDFKMEANIDTAIAEESMENAKNVISAAIDRGVWTKQDSMTYHEMTQNLSGKAIHETNRKIAIAINNGELQIDNNAPILFP